jgi:hypothetical protein
MLIYERTLDSNTDLAIREGSRHFEEKSAVHEALRKITSRLDELGIPYAVAGGMAMFAHGYRRFTEDVDIVVTEQGLRAIHENLDGRGYLPIFAGSKNLRDTERGVRVEFLLSGEYPGDGKPKPVTFPNPGDAAVEIEGVRYLQLARLVELKLASGMTARGRLLDLGDVERLIAVLELPDSLSEQLDPSVREKYLELWEGVQAVEYKHE